MLKTIIFLLMFMAVKLQNGQDLQHESKRLLVDDPNLMSQRLSALEKRVQNQQTENSALKNTVLSLQTTVQSLQTTVTSLHTTVQSYQFSYGTMYIRWGRSGCSNDTELVYSGFTAGQSARTGGGVATTICLPSDPTWGKQIDIGGVEIDGAEYEGNGFGPHTADEDIPCAACRKRARSSVIMIPGRFSCYPGLTMEYRGYLAGGHYMDPSDYICIDEYPEVVMGGEANDDSGRRYFPAKSYCGPLPCPPYHDGKTVACVVCSK